MVTATAAAHRLVSELYRLQGDHMNREENPAGGPHSMFRLLASAPPARGKREAASLVTSFAVHAAAVAGLVWATLAVGEEIAEDEEVVTIIEVTEEVPPPPPPPPEPEAPPPPEVEIPQGFQTLATPEIVPPEIPPPGEKVEERDFTGEGVEGGVAEGVPMPAAVTEATTFSFTPYTEKPKCRAGCTPEDILRHVPPLLKRSGVECHLTIGIHVDLEGNVTATDLLKSSGNDGCDRAAQEWAGTTRWTTAYNRDQAVQVWIAQPVSIQTQ